MKKWLKTTISLLLAIIMIVGNAAIARAEGGYITIEQERDPRNQETSLRDIKASVDYLKSVGYQI